MKSTAFITPDSCSPSIASVRTPVRPVATNTASCRSRSASSVTSRPSATPVCNAMPPTDSSHSTSRCAKSSTVL
jgi:hypothetical protein